MKLTDICKAYRASQLIDGKLYPPMATKIEGNFVIGLFLFTKAAK